VTKKNLIKVDNKEHIQRSMYTLLESRIGVTERNRANLLYARDTIFPRS